MHFPNPHGFTCWTIGGPILAGNEWDGEWKSGEINYRGVYTRKSDGRVFFEGKWEAGQKHPTRVGTPRNLFTSSAHRAGSGHWPRPWHGPVR